jgi:hypothetical protein
MISVALTLHPVSALTLAPAVPALERLARPAQAMNTTIPVPIIAALIAAFVAVAGYLINHYLDRKKDARLRQISRLEAQLRDFYGPLMALSHANHEIFHQWLRTYREGKKYFMSETDPPTDEQKNSWRIWIETVLQPLNVKMTSIVVERSQLIDGGSLPNSLRVLLAHVEGYKPVIAAWNKGDYSRHLSIVDYPLGLHEQICKEYERLSDSYSRLIKISNKAV